MTFATAHVRILLIAIAMVYALLHAMPVAATGWHSAPIMVKPPVVVAPPPPAPVVVTPPPPATAAAPASTPAQQPSGGGGGSGFNPGYLVMAGVALFFFAVICTKEREVNPAGWFARSCKPQWMQ